MKRNNKLTQVELIKSVRKPMAGPTRVERPRKGGGYKRPQGGFSKWMD